MPKIPAQAGNYFIYHKDCLERGFVKSGGSFLALNHKSDAGGPVTARGFSLTGDYPGRRISLGYQLLLAVYNKTWQKNSPRPGGAAG
jgi:hypothetical protein